jgi:8-oxo-dGTP pyrophosphatase MutT (NUDIX family)
MDLGNGTPASPLASATVLMLRDAPGGLEVFLLKRHGLSDVLGGAYVFPGGKVDRDDGQLADRLDQGVTSLRDALGEPELSDSQATALYVAAIREVFEESGVLFADIVPVPDDLHAARALQRSGGSFVSYQFAFNRLDMMSSHELQGVVDEDIDRG